ncbi:hypothetical protein E2C01_058035 [Portunus trituberculatus]|uniref:Uncharacterized protein n=1 Tax=Portunus trituberculatus TaxID=210409 RepID=A0A5B7H3K7_PORTR|nr:hypothetical protein [Portunus trituberculatus]
MNPDCPLPLQAFNAALGLDIVCIHPLHYFGLGTQEICQTLMTVIMSQRRIISGAVLRCSEFVPGAPLHPSLPQSLGAAHKAREKGKVDNRDPYLCAA